VTFHDFEEFIGSLNENRVRYLIVGGYAVAFHARPRATKDIDVLVDRSLANAKRLRIALAAFLGSEESTFDLAALTNPRTLLVLGSPPVRIDVLTAIDGVPSFMAAWKRRSEGVYASTPAHYISLTDLIASKRAAGRAQDKADVDVLERVAARVSRSEPRPRKKAGAGRPRRR
jgi:hypothetical protein